MSWKWRGWQKPPQSTRIQWHLLLSHPFPTEIRQVLLASSSKPATQWSSFLLLFSSLSFFLSNIDWQKDSFHRCINSLIVFPLQCMRDGGTWYPSNGRLLVRCDLLISPSFPFPFLLSSLFPFQQQRECWYEMRWKMRRRLIEFEDERQQKNEIITSDHIKWIPQRDEDEKQEEGKKETKDRHLKPVRWYEEEENRHQHGRNDENFPLSLPSFVDFFPPLSLLVMTSKQRKRKGKMKKKRMMKRMWKKEKKWEIDERQRTQFRD